MNKHKRIMSFVLLFYLLSSPVYAACTAEEKQEFKKIEDKFNAYYQYDKETNSNSIIIINNDWNGYGVATNVNEDVRCKEYDGYIKCTNVSPGNYTISFFKESETCDDILKDVNIKVSKYNEFYNDPLCEGIEEFVLCQPTYDGKIDRTEFESRIATYKKNKKNNPSSTKEDNKTLETNKIIEYIKDNIVQLIVIVVFAILVIITIILTVKNIKKSRRLE